MPYIPDRGDIVETNFDPQAGHEQAGSRPALVLSRKTFNEPAGLAILCSITSRQKGYPFEVALPSDAVAYGVILVDHVKSLDWQARQVRFRGRIPDSVLAEVNAKLKTLLT